MIGPAGVGVPLGFITTGVGVATMVDFMEAGEAFITHGGTVTTLGVGDGAVMPTILISTVDGTLGALPMVITMGIIIIDTDEELMLITVPEEVIQPVLLPAVLLV